MIAGDVQARRDAGERKSSLIGVAAGFVILAGASSIFLLPVQPAREATARVISIRQSYDRYDASWW